MITYKKSGVDVAKAEKIVGNIRKIFPHIGGYAGEFRFGGKILAATCDGVGTKLKLAIEFDAPEVVGEDLVAMSVNDLIAQKARPLFFLDYFACGKLDEKLFNRVFLGIKRGLKKAKCLLLGGEIAEMPGIYAKKNYDLAGFAVGEKIPSPSQKIREGDYIVAIKSNGVHSNGFSLIRKIFTESELRKNKSLFLKPTRIYSELPENPQIYKLAKKIAHVTGGGLERALSRLLPKDLSAEIFPFEVPRVFRLIASKKVAKNELPRVFNMGWGMILATDEKKLPKILKMTRGKVIGMTRKRRVGRS